MDIANMKVTELKAELKKRGLPVGGVKKDLVARLNEAIENEGAETEEQEEEKEEATEDSPEEEQADKEEEPEPESESTKEEAAPVDTEDKSEGTETKEDEPTLEQKVEEDVADATDSAKKEEASAPVEEVESKEPVKEELSTDEGKTAETDAPAENEERMDVDEDRQGPSEQEDKSALAQETVKEEPKEEASVKVEEGNTEDVEMKDTDSSDAPREAVATEDVEMTTAKPDEAVHSVTLTDEQVQEAMDVTPDVNEIRKRKRRSASPVPPGEEEEPESKKHRSDSASPNGDRFRDERPRSRSRSFSPRRRPSHSNNNNARPDPRFRALVNKPSDTGREQREDSEEESIPPSTHPATRGVYIENLMRPLKEPELTSHLTALAASDPASPNPDAIESFYLDNIKTHAFVVFSSISEATRVRSRLHNRVWPKERDRKPLRVDFFPEEKFQEWVTAETAARGGRGRMIKWRVRYDRDGDDVLAILEDASNGPAASGPPPRGSAASFSGGVAPPTGPRADRDRPYNDRRGELRGEVREQDGRKVKVVALDELFMSTRAKPRLYYRPVSEEVVRERLERREEMQRNGRRMGRFLG